MELAANQNIDLVSGDHATVVGELGRSVHGIVYLVEVSGRKMAIKWYSEPPADADCLYSSLQRNIHDGAPSDAFIWPLDITVKTDGCFGYVMRLRPKGYAEFGSFLLARARFKSFAAMFAAAMKICDGFRSLHRQGCIYPDLNDGNFLINPETGDVLICDNDNVFADGQKSGVRGKARYMAPELVAGGLPNEYSDRFSLSVILFLLFFVNHPFEGSRASDCTVMTAEFEKKLYGSEAVFIFDPDNRSNRPVPGKHVNVIRRWPVFPKVLKDAFVQAFSQERLKEPETRMTEGEWEKVIASARDTLAVCPHCREETFFDPANGMTACVNCGKKIGASEALPAADLPESSDDTPAAGSGDLADWVTEPLPEHSDLSHNRKTAMTVFFLVDTSESMDGRKIEAVNEAVREVIPAIGKISAANSGIEIRVAALQFSSGARCVYDESSLPSDFVWHDLSAKGASSDLGAACRELSSRLSGDCLIKSASGFCAPAIILLSGSEPTDDFDAGLAELKKNIWFSQAVRIAIAIGDDADEEKLAQFTGSSEAVFNVHNIDALKGMIRAVALTSSMSGSSHAGGTSFDDGIYDDWV